MWPKPDHREAAEIEELEVRINKILKKSRIAVSDVVTHYWRGNDVSVVKTGDGLVTVNLTTQETGSYGEVYRRWPINTSPFVRLYLLSETLHRLRQTMVLDDLIDA